MASMRKRGDSWRVEWRYGGVRTGQREGCTFASETNALAAKELVEARRHRITTDETYKAVTGVEPRPAPPVPTLKAWIKEWGETKAALREVQPDTLRTYLLHLNTWAVPRLGKMRLDLIDEDHIKDWTAWLSKQNQHNRTKKLSPNTVRKIHALLHQVFAAAMPRLIPRNPCAKPPGSRRGNTGLPKPIKFEAVFLTPDEASIVLKCCSDAIRDLVFFTLRTGLRLGELVALRVEDLDLGAAQPTVYVRHALKNDGSIGDPKSAKSKRAVSISTSVVKLCRPLVKDRPRAGTVFVTPTGSTWDKDNIRERHWKRAVVSACRCKQHPPEGGARQVSAAELKGPRCGDNGGLRSNRRPCGAVVLPGTDRCHNHQDPPKDAISTCDCPTRLHKPHVRFHDLRHTHAAWCIATGHFDAYELSRRLGHESIQTTMDIYGHLMPQGEQDGLDALDELAA